MILLDLIKQAEETQKGGEGYFNLLDRGIKKSPILLDWLTDSGGVLVTSGELGDILLGLFKRKLIISFSTLGRKTVNNSEHTVSIGNYTENLLRADPNLCFTYIDDSIYSGEVRNTAFKLLKSYELTSKLVYTGTRVIYDGMIFRDPKITSLYRYHP